ncbi:unnamed protein product [Paramecium octaurelia]|uniref:Uncharacterized protein n=1 Tax=Paramecium octaurelia TaxID=43137 RepID=A0A8S1YLI5_PAROT|nr:unnamed protein product [Paramecium octaurelia]
MQHFSFASIIKTYSATCSSYIWIQIEFIIESQLMIVNIICQVLVNVDPYSIQSQTHNPQEKILIDVTQKLTIKSQVDFSNTAELW